MFTNLSQAFVLQAALVCCPPTDQTSDPHAAQVLLGAVSGEQAAAPAAPAAPATPAAPAAPTATKRIVELAICLDTSGSMEGLINAARVKLWEIVNDLALAKPTPSLRVALLTYGNDGHNAENGWVNIDVPFTEDLDLVSDRLFALTTNGGTELVGRVLKAANEQLAWTPSDDVLKIAVVAGNESADQDQQFNFREVCKAAIAKGVMVNSIYCGNVGDDIAPGWKEVSTLADGHFAAIDQNNGTVVISTPFDDQLVTLSSALNETYLPFGADGERYALNQVRQDNNAVGCSSAVAAQRCATKGGALYFNGQWDLVDACKDASFKLEEVKDADLPESMRTMTLEQKREHINAMAAKRAQVQAQVAEMNAKRQAHVEAEMKKMAEAGANSFDAAIRKAIRQQAASKGFTFEEPKVALEDGC